MNRKILEISVATAAVAFLAAIPPLAVFVHMMFRGGLTLIGTLALALVYALQVAAATQASLACAKGYQLAGDVALNEIKSQTWRLLKTWHIAMGSLLVVTALCIDRPWLGLLGSCAQLMCVGILALTVGGLAHMPQSIRNGLEDRIMAAMRVSMQREHPASPSAAARRSDPRSQEDDQRDQAGVSGHGLKPRRD